MYAVLAGFIGLLVGAGELIARYRDAPFRAVETLPGFGYILINALVAALAFRMIHSLDALHLATSANRAMWEVLAGGFGAMAFFRSSLFTVRIGDKDVPVGPSLFLQVILAATDRACDRLRAKPRAGAVREIMQGVDFQRAAAALPAVCFNLMQNVSKQEQQDFATTTAELRNSDMDDTSRTYVLGLALMNVVGEGVLRSAVQSLGGQIRGPVRATTDVIGRLGRVNFARDGATFAQAVATLSGEAGTAARNDAVRIYDDVARVSLADQDKTLLLATGLISRFGPGIVSAALDFVATVPPAAAAPLVPPVAEAEQDNVLPLVTTPATAPP